MDFSAGMGPARGFLYMAVAVELVEPGVGISLQYATEACKMGLRVDIDKALKPVGLSGMFGKGGYPQQLWLRLSGCLSDARNEKLTLQNSLLLRPGVFTTPLFHFYICISGKSSV